MPIDKEEARAYFLAASIEEKSGNLEAAISIYSNLLDRSPRNESAYYFRGLCYEKLIRYPEAIIDYTKSIELEDEDANYYYRRGMCKLKLGYIQEANADFHLALEVELYPWNRQDFIVQCAAKRCLGDVKGAIEGLSNFIDRQSSHTSHAYYERAITRLEMEDVKGAKEDIDRAIQFSLDRQTLFDINKAYEFEQKFIDRAR